MSLQPTPEQRERSEQQAREFPATIGRIAGGLAGAVIGRRRSGGSSGGAPSAPHSPVRRRSGFSRFLRRSR